MQPQEFQNPQNPQDNYTQQTPISPTPPNVSPENLEPKKSSLKITVLATILILLLGGGAFAYYSSKNNEKQEFGGSVSLDGSASNSACIPIISTEIDKSSALKTYERFAKAIASKNQGCANDLSTSFFLELTKQAYDTPDGNWITAEPLGLRPIHEDFSQLPDNFDETTFQQAEYQRAVVAGSSDQSTPTGITLSYPVDLTKFTGNTTEKWQISVSFISDSNAIKVDSLVVEPQN